MESSYNSPSTKPLFHVIQILWYILGLLELLLVFRFVFKLMAANGDAAFTNLIYTLSAPFVAPFAAVFNTTNVSGNVFEWTTLLAILVYWVIVTLIVNLFLMGKTVSTKEAARELDN
jgi:uncharacterized protein YggT (Ycf19 family)